MQELLLSVKNVFENAGYGPLAVLVSVLLGVLSAVASSCCTVPLVGALAGYTVAHEEMQKKALLTGLMFMSGMVIALLVMGGVVVFTGQTFQKIAGDYWKILAGIAAIGFGIGALELFPFTLPKTNFIPVFRTTKVLGPSLAGVVFGGAIAISSLPCNPGIFIILGAAVLQKHALWAFVNLFAYSIGFSAPLSIMVFGLSLSKNLIRFQKVEKTIRISAGILLIAAGIYLFYSF